MNSRFHNVAVGLAAASVAPYIVLKALWLSGSTIGLQTDAAINELHSTRMVVGNGLTVGLAMLAIGLVVALTRPWGRRVPGWIVLLLAGGATGLLAPILLGLPVGGLLQLGLRGEVHTSGMDDMAGWVFTLVYGGFGVLAITVAVVARQHAFARWGDVLDHPPHPPLRWPTVFGAVGMLPFAMAMLWWGVRGPGEGGPPQMDAIAQRVVVAVTGLLVVAGVFAPLLGAASARRSRAAWLALWVGCMTAALQGPTEVLLANGGHPSRVMVALGLLAVPAAVVYGATTLRASAPPDRRDRRRGARLASAGRVYLDVRRINRGSRWSRG